MVVDGDGDGGGGGALCVGMSIKESEPPTLNNVFSFFLSFLDTQRFMGPSGNL